MARFTAESLQQLTPFTSEHNNSLTKGGAKSKTQKAPSSVHPFFARASAQQFASRNTWFTLARGILFSSNSTTTFASSSSIKKLLNYKNNLLKICQGLRNLLKDMLPHQNTTDKTIKNMSMTKKLKYVQVEIIF